MKQKSIIILTLAAGLAVTSLMAQNDQRPRGPRPDGEGQAGERHHSIRRMLPPPLVATLDANHDGTISADEIANAPAALKILDKNNDGALQVEELRPKPPEGAGEGQGAERKGPPPDESRPERKGPRPGGQGPDGGKDFHPPIPPVPPVIRALDANGDKTISADEIANASNALKTLDKNGDGQLTKEEMRPEPPPRGEN